MKKVTVYIHGKGGSVEEARHYEKFFSDEYDVMGFDYKSELPWEAKSEFQKYFADISLGISFLYSKQSYHMKYPEQHSLW